MDKHQTDTLFEVEEAGPEVIRGHIIRVAFESAADAEFDYLVPDELWPVSVGQRVEVPFGRKNKLQKGFCVESDIPSEEAFGSAQRGIRLKAVSHVVDKEPLVDSELMALTRWISGYYVCPLGQVLAAIVPAAVKKGAGVKTRKYAYLTVNADDIERITGELRG
ncbi:MAG: hypothetical protein U9Q07_07300, partial [Planctomycetota bacterium]|nr:hypothetical protein [Planctomycetota bacterium]